MNLIILKGLLIGFVTSISFGPIALLIIQKTGNNNYKSGLMAGLGASTAETIFAVIAGSGVGLAFNFIEQYQMPISFIGSLIILALGLKLFLTKKSSNKINKRENIINTHAPDFFSAFLLEIFNPLTLFMFIFLFTIFKVIPKEVTTLKLFEFYFCVFLGTNLWWSLIVILSNILRKKLKLQNLQWLNKIMGSIIILLGMILLINVFSNKKITEPQNMEMIKKAKNIKSIVIEHKHKILTFLSF